MTTLFRPWHLVLAFVAVSGRASVDFDYPKPESSALTHTADTYLGKQLEGKAEAHPGMAGFYALSDGIDALAARLLLADRAERSIDAQYYLIKEPQTTWSQRFGAGFMRILPIRGQL